MKHLASSFALVLALVGASLVAPSVAAADDQAINDTGQTSTVDCGDGGNVAINGSQNTLTITGVCASVALNGTGNTVTIDASASVAVSGVGNTLTVKAADKIAVTGSGNKVTWSKGLKAKKPKLVKLGVRNTYRRAK